MGSASGYMFYDFGRHIVWKFSDSSLARSKSDLCCWLKISHDNRQVMRQRLCQRTEEALYEGSGFCCGSWTPFWGSESGLPSKDDTHSCSKPATFHLHDFSNHPLRLQNTLLKFCASSAKLQSRKTEVSLHVSNIHVSCC